MIKSQAVLIVEDEALIGHCLADTVGERGGEPVGPFATVKGAMEALESVTVAGAILDGKLLDGDVTPLAMRLAQSATPIVVHSGTGMPAEVACRWPAIPFLPKPAPASAVVDLLCAEMTRLVCEAE